MKYLCLVCFEGKDLDALARAGTLEELSRESLAYDEELMRRGRFVHAEALQSPDTAITVRVRDGKLSTTDGPFAETKEQVGGFVLVEARDLNEAVQLAAGIPLARIGSIEVRPILEIEVPAVREDPAAERVTT
jgi:hypothetical protein